MRRYGFGDCLIPICSLTAEMLWVPTTVLIFWACLACQAEAGRKSDESSSRPGAATAAASSAAGPSTSQHKSEGATVPTGKVWNGVGFIIIKGRWVEVPCDHQLPTANCQLPTAN